MRQLSRSSIRLGKDLCYGKYPECVVTQINVVSRFLVTPGGNRRLPYKKHEVIVGNFGIKFLFISNLKGTNCKTTH